LAGEREIERVRNGDLKRQDKRKAGMDINRKRVREKDRSEYK
jgi:hypothetical protein